MTFKEKFDPKVISSLGEEEIVFTNYNAEQIKKILEERINFARYYLSLNYNSHETLGMFLNLQ